VTTERHVEQEETEGTEKTERFDDRNMRTDTKGDRQVRSGANRWGINATARIVG
jgi:hypothetical protein